MTPIVEFSTADIGSTTAYVVQIINDLKPLIILLAGLYIGFMIVSFILRLVRERKELPD